jgi:hypothetical protein
MNDFSRKLQQHFGGKQVPRQFTFDSRFELSKCSDVTDNVLRCCPARFCHFFFDTSAAEALFAFVFVNNVGGGGWVAMLL